MSSLLIASFEEASIATRSFLVLVFLGSGVSRALAGCALGFYNPLQRRHGEGAVPGTAYSLAREGSAAQQQQLRQLLAAVSLRHRSHHAFCCS